MTHRMLGGSKRINVILSEVSAWAAPVTDSNLAGFGTAVYTTRALRVAEAAAAVVLECPVLSMVPGGRGDTGDAQALPFGRVGAYGQSPSGARSVTIDAREGGQQMARARRPKWRAGSLPAELPRVNLNAAGIDVGATTHYVAVPPGRDPDGHDVREFGAFTCELYRMADWLQSCGATSVVLEATGVYWIPVFEVLEARGLTVQLVDSRRLISARAFHARRGVIRSRSRSRPCGGRNLPRSSRCSDRS